MSHITEVMSNIILQKFVYSVIFHNIGMCSLIYIITQKSYFITHTSQLKMNLNYII